MAQIETKYSSHSSISAICVNHLPNMLANGRAMVKSYAEIYEICVI